MHRASPHAIAIALAMSLALSAIACSSDDTTNDPPAPAGTCFASNAIGNTGSVLSRGGMPIDTTCDPEPMPCGGNPVGTWTLESYCGLEMAPNPLADDCPGSTYMLEALSWAGTLTFADDGTFTRSFVIPTTTVYSFDPWECFDVDCAGWERDLQEVTPEWSCSAMGSTCTCTFTDEGMRDGMGTYEVMGNDLVRITDNPFAPEGSYTSSDTFCIAGDRLAVWEPIYEQGTVTDTRCEVTEDCADALGDAYDDYFCVPPRET